MHKRAPGSRFNIESRGGQSVGGDGQHVLVGPMAVTSETTQQEGQAGRAKKIVLFQCQDQPGDMMVSIGDAAMLMLKR